MEAGGEAGKSLADMVALNIGQIGENMALGDINFYSSTQGDLIQSFLVRVIHNRAVENSFGLSLYSYTVPYYTAGAVYGTVPTYLGTDLIPKFCKTVIRGTFFLALYVDLLLDPDHSKCSARVFLFKT